MKRRWARRLTGLLQVYRHVDLDNSRRDRRLWRGPFDVFDGFSLAFIGLIALVLVARADGLDPFVSDTWYHLATAKQVAERGEIPDWMDWDYQPVGRPNVYPPLIHVLVAGLSKVTGDVLTAGRAFAVLFLPASFLSCWFAARWIFDSRTALVAVLVLSLDALHAFIEMLYIPSCFTNILGPLLLITILTRRTLASIVLLTLLGYSHLGVPYLAAFGLVLFALKYPRYRGEVALVCITAFLFASPWLYKAWSQRAWLSAGIPGGFMMLHSLNLVLIGCGLWGIRNLKKHRAQEAIVRWALIGMVPLLLSYGGRYTMHSAPLWAISAATVLVRLLPAGATWKRAAALVAATLLPTPALMPLTTTHAMIMMGISGRPMMGGDETKGEALFQDSYDAIAWVEEHTEPGEIVHVNKEWIADMIPLLSDRRSDWGCWWECSREIGKLQNRAYRDNGDRRVFVCIRPKSDTGSILGPTERMPHVDEAEEIGRFVVGVRWTRLFEPLKQVDGFGEGTEVKWEVGGEGTGGQAWVTETPSSSWLSWHIPAGATEAELGWPVSAAEAGGIALTMRTSAPLEGLKLGLTEEDGSRFAWDIAVPSVAEALPVTAYGPPLERPLWQRVRVAFDWLTPVGGTEDDGEGEARQLDLGQVRSMWLSVPPMAEHAVQVDIDEVMLMRVAVVPDEEEEP